MRKIIHGEEVEVTDVGDKQFLIGSSIVVSGNVYLFLVWFGGLVAGFLLGLIIN